MKSLSFPVYGDTQERTGPGGRGEIFRAAVPGYILGRLINSKIYHCSNTLVKYERCHVCMPHTSHVCGHWAVSNYSAADFDSPVRP